MKRLTAHTEAHVGDFVIAYKHCIPNKPRPKYLPKIGRVTHFDTTGDDRRLVMICGKTIRRHDTGFDFEWCLEYRAVFKLTDEEIMEHVILENI